MIDQYHGRLRYLVSLFFTGRHDPPSYIIMIQSSRGRSSSHSDSPPRDGRASGNHRTCPRRTAPIREERGDDRPMSRPRPLKPTGRSPQRRCLLLEGSLALRHDLLFGVTDDGRLVTSLTPRCSARRDIGNGNAWMVCVCGEPMRDIVEKLVSRWAE
jgi:hypothetical protein